MDLPLIDFTAWRESITPKLKDKTLLSIAGLSKSEAQDIIIQE